MMWSIWKNPELMLKYGAFVKSYNTKTGEQNKPLADIPFAVEMFHSGAVLTNVEPGKGGTYENVKFK